MTEFDKIKEKAVKETVIPHEKKEMIPFSEVQKIFDTYLMLEDRGIVRLIAATMIGNQLKTDPIWLMIVGSSSGGKTETLMRFVEVQKKGKKLCSVVSDVSAAGFLSGQRGSEQDSILNMVDTKGGMIIFKDFTSVISKRKEDRAVILGQMREIYDGTFIRRLGNGAKEWKGKVGIIGACTGVIYSALHEMGAMGERLVMYQIEQPDRMGALNFIWKKEDDGIDGRDEMDEVSQTYVEGMLRYIEENDKLSAKLPDEVRTNLSEVANFCTLARSPVIRNFRGDMILEVPEPEMPMRTAKQLINIARAFMIMNEAEGLGETLSEKDMHILYKIAFDSIPNTYRDVLRVLTSYFYGGTIVAISTEMGMPVDTIRYRLQDLEARKIIEKIDDPNGKDKYLIYEEYADIMSRFENIEIKKEELKEEEDDSTRNQEYQEYSGEIKF